MSRAQISKNRKMETWSMYIILLAEIVQGRGEKVHLAGHGIGHTLPIQRPGNTVELCSFSNPSVTSPTSQLIIQPFRRFTYVTAHSPTHLSLLLRHWVFTYVTWGAALVWIKDLDKRGLACTFTRPDSARLLPVGSHEELCLRLVPLLVQGKIAGAGYDCRECWTTRYWWSCVR